MSDEHILLVKEKSGVLDKKSLLFKWDSLVRQNFESFEL